MGRQVGPGPFRDPPMGGRRGFGLSFAAGPWSEAACRSAPPPPAGQQAISRPDTSPHYRGGLLPGGGHLPCTSLPAIFTGVLAVAVDRHRPGVDICSLGQVGSRLDGEGAVGCTPGQRGCSSTPRPSASGAGHRRAATARFAREGPCAGPIRTRAWLRFRSPRRVRIRRQRRLSTRSRWLWALASGLRRGRDGRSGPAW